MKRQTSALQSLQNLISNTAYSIGGLIVLGIFCFFSIFALPLSLIVIFASACFIMTLQLIQFISKRPLQMVGLKEDRITGPLHYTQEKAIYVRSQARHMVDRIVSKLFLPIFSRFMDVQRAIWGVIRHFPILRSIDTKLSKKQSRSTKNKEAEKNGKKPVRRRSIYRTQTPISPNNIAKRILEKEGLDFQKSYYDKKLHVEQLEYEREEKQEEIVKLRKRVAALEQENQGWKDLNGHKQREIEDMKTHELQMIVQVKDLETKYLNLREDNMKLNDDILRHGKDLYTLKHEKEELQLIREALNKEIEQLRQEKQQLQRKMEDLARENNPQGEQGKNEERLQKQASDETEENEVPVETAN